MKNKDDFPKHSVDSLIYDQDYFLLECNGFDEFIHTKGQVLPKRLTIPLSIADPKPGMRVLDMGCGRGESLFHLSQQKIEIWGIDFSQQAIQLSKQLVDDANLVKNSFAYLIQANTTELPFPEESFDVILMLDIIEHLNPDELQKAFKEAFRLLRNEGKLVIHTAPNLWYYKYGYPFYRFFEMLSGNNLPKDPRERFTYHKLVHINEQSPKSLTRSLTKAGFISKVWTDDFHRIWEKKRGIGFFTGWLVTHACLLKDIFCGDILASAQKRSRF